MDNTEYLYHYTNIETLALILKNRTIRFNSLDKMDDLQEKETADVKNAGQFCYISSWTDDATESLPMWNMYASPNLGVRIKLRKNPFKLYDNTAAELSKVVKTPITDKSNGKPLKSLIPLTDIFSKKFFAVQTMNPNILSKVEYTNDKNKLYPQILNEEGERFSLALGELGKYKNLHWSFQNEWRYILLILPFNLNQSVDAMTFDIQLMAHKIKMGLAVQPFPHYDMVISDESFEDMEITLSPRISAGSKIIVENLVSKYNLSATIKESDLVGLI